MAYIKKLIGTAVTAALVLGLSSAAIAGDSGSSTNLDPQAGALLKKMSDYMGELKSFTVDAHMVDEQIMGDGFKLSMLKVGSITVQRPNRFYVAYKSAERDNEVFFDGSHLVVHGKHIGMFFELPVRAAPCPSMVWTTTTAPGTITFPAVASGSASRRRIEVP